MGFLKIEVLENGREVLKMKNSVVATIITSDHKILVGTQTRAGSADENGNTYKSIGCVAGYVDNGECYEDALFREIMEEANLDARHIGHVINLTRNKPKASSEGYSTEKSKMYIGISKYSSEELSKIMKCNDLDEDIELSFIEPDMDILDSIPGMKSFYVIQQAINVIDFLEGNLSVIPVKLTVPAFIKDEMFAIEDKTSFPVFASCILGHINVHITVKKTSAGKFHIFSNNRRYDKVCDSIAEVIKQPGVKKTALRAIRYNLSMETEK